MKTEIKVSGRMKVSGRRSWGKREIVGYGAMCKEKHGPKGVTFALCLNCHLFLFLNPTKLCLSLVTFLLLNLGSFIVLASYVWPCAILSCFLKAGLMSVDILCGVSFSSERTCSLILIFLDHSFPLYLF